MRGALKVALLAAATATAAVASAEEAEAVRPAPLRQGFMVIAGGGATREEGQAKLDRYRSDGFPSHDDYPGLVLSTGVQGLKPGFWIVVAAVARDRQVAERLAAFVKQLGGDAYVREVQVAEPEDLKVVAIEHITLEDEAPGKAPRTLPRWVGIEQRCFDHTDRCNYGAEPRGKSAVTKSGAACVPFTVSPLKGSQVSLRVELPASFLEKYSLMPETCESRFEEGSTGLVLDDHATFLESSAANVLRVPRVTTGCGVFGD